jgi:phosphatidate cytidylyltransferase
VHFDSSVLLLFGSVAGLLTVATFIGWLLGRSVTEESKRKVIDNLNARIRAWWFMVLIFLSALALGRMGATVLFGLLSFLALREFVTVSPTARGDHRALFWAFFIILPIQYWLVYTQQYGVFSIFVPVYAFLFLPIRQAFAGVVKQFLVRTAIVQWALMICVYCLSHAPALLMLKLRGSSRGSDGGALLLFFLVTVVELSDVLQYVWGKLFGRHKIAPVLSPSKTWEGFLGGVLSASGVGMALWWITPFRPWQAGLLALAAALLGFFGGLVMSAIKRDRGVKDWGALIEGHGGILDRLDSLCFAAPIFFHLTRRFFSID